MRLIETRRTEDRGRDPHSGVKAFVDAVTPRTFRRFWSPETRRTMTVVESEGRQEWVVPSFVNERPSEIWYERVKAVAQILVGYANADQMMVGKQVARRVLQGGAASKETIDALLEAAEAMLE